MGKKSDWSDKMTPALKTAIQQVAHASYMNACELIKDAMVLRREGRYARAGALVILSEEELSKALILLVCLEQNRWDSVIVDALRRHPEKQGMANGMREYMAWLVENYERAMKMNQASFVPLTPATFPDRQRWEGIIANTKQEISSKRKDRLKQSLLYVGLDRSANITSDPRDVDMSVVDNCFNETKRFKEIVEQAMLKLMPGFSPVVI
jgi:AbiV family abortive infection protein